MKEIKELYLIELGCVHKLNDCILTKCQFSLNKSIDSEKASKFLKVTLLEPDLKIERHRLTGSESSFLLGFLPKMYADCVDQ